MRANRNKNHCLRGTIVIVIYLLGNGIGQADFEFQAPTNLGLAINSSMDESRTYISGDGLSHEFTRGADLWITQRAESQDPWNDVINYGPYGDATSTVTLITNVTGGYTWGLETDDGLESYWYGFPPSSSDLSVLRRETVDADWGPPENLGPKVNSSVDVFWPYLSPDGSTLYFTSNRSGGYGGNDLWQAAVDPVVDFNGASYVDCTDICDLVAHMGTTDSLYDIGPMPWGDGIVDEKDLLVLAEHMVEISDANEL